MTKAMEGSQMILEKYSFGHGDRFGCEGKAQLQAIIKAEQAGVDITPVWNKSHREHKTIGSRPSDVRVEADAAVQELEWDGPYYVDADHIGLKNVDLFSDWCDFFTLDVADFIGQRAADEDIKAFVDNHRDLAGTLAIEGITENFEISAQQIEQIAAKFLLAVKEAGRVFRHIESVRGTGTFVTEVSMDETDAPQSPVEMLFILAAIADEDIPAQTIAPKFTGRFNKGVDYVGDVTQFAKEFERDIAVIRFAVKNFGLSKNLKLSVHSGSDKFSIYPAIRHAIRKFDAGVHIKTAGTTWLEELTGLAEADGQGLVIAKKVYARALERFDELCAPYATVINIDKNKLPGIVEVGNWDGPQFAAALRHDQSSAEYNPHFRQLLHVGYKVAAEMGDEYSNALEKYEDVIAGNVTENIFERHIKPIFIG